jgi:predicted phosphodiesterase
MFVKNTFKKKVDLVRAYRELDADMPSKKMARIIYKNHPLLFNYEDTIRRILGKIEKLHKRSVTVTHPIEGHRPYNPYGLPASDAVSYEPYIFPQFERVGVMNDIHLPYHDIAALTAAIDFLKKTEVEAVYLNGDIVDFHSVSYFEKDPKAKRFSEELDTLKRFLELLTKELNCKVYYKFGNHEERYDKFLNMKAHELDGVDEFKLENIIKRRFDCEIIRDKRVVIINGLPYIHGHEFGRGVFSPVNAARGLFLQAKHSCVKGDCHTTSEHTEPDIMGKIMTTYSIGALCHLNPKWLPLNKWNHGVAVQHNASEGRYRLENRRIFNGEII